MFDPYKWTIKGLTLPPREIEGAVCWNKSSLIFGPVLVDKALENVEEEKIIKEITAKFYEHELTVLVYLR